MYIQVVYNPVCVERLNASQLDERTRTCQVDIYLVENSRSDQVPVFNEHEGRPSS